MVRPIKKTLTNYTVLALLWIPVLLTLFITCERFEPERQIVLTIDTIVNVSSNSCIAEGYIHDESDNGIQQYGFCWSTFSAPTTSNDTIQISRTGIQGPFQGYIQGLLPETKYYVRAYGINGKSIYYGNEKNFTTAQVIAPGVITLSATAITQTSANVGGNITSDEIAAVLDRGVYYGLSANPRSTGTKVTAGTGSGPFTTNLSSLTKGTIYYYVAYAENSGGITFGDDSTFITTSGTTPISPSVTTISASSIGETTATIGGNVTSAGGATVSERGVYYGLSANPRSTGKKEILGNGIGPFSLKLLDLANKTTYYFVAYAINTAGTSFGDDLNFITDTTVIDAAVTTTAATTITETSALVGGNVTDDGGGIVLDRGIYYGISSNPQSSGTKVPKGSGTGSFSTTLTGLSTGTKYYFVAYATNNSGTSYGSVLPFETKVFSPSVTTSSATSVTETSALLGGNVTDDGGGTVTNRGFYYGTTTDPQTSGTQVSQGSGTGVFSASLSSLSPGTRYYYVAYASNSSVPEYGIVMDFTTLAFKPTVITSAATEEGQTSAIVGGDVTDNGGGTVTDKGIYYGTSSDPLSTGTQVSIGSGTGSFSATLSGLLPGNRYYYVAYATNSGGTSNGVTLPFDTEPDNTVTDKNGNIYETVVIGDQTWMAENLRVTKFPNGVGIQLVENITAWDQLTTDDKAYCYYNNSSTNGNEYGALYTWSAAMNGAGSSDDNPSGIQGVCPEGWHLPSDSEWKEMEIAIGMSQSEADKFGSRGTDEGKQLKADYGWNNDGNGTDDHGFSILPAGRRNLSGSFLDIYDQTYIWTTTESSSYGSYYRGLFSGDSDVDRYDYSKAYGLSVRCIKD